MSEVPVAPTPEAITARMYVASTSKAAHGDGVHLQVAYSNGANKEWAASTPTGKVELTLARGNGASRFFNEALEAGDDIEITFRRVPRGA